MLWQQLRARIGAVRCIPSAQLDWRSQYRRRALTFTAANRSRSASIPRIDPLPRETLPEYEAFTTVERA